MLPGLDASGNPLSPALTLCDGAMTVVGSGWNTPLDGRLALLDDYGGHVLLLCTPLVVCICGVHLWCAFVVWLRVLFRQIGGGATIIFELESCLRACVWIVRSHRASLVKMLLFQSPTSEDLRLFWW